MSARAGSPHYSPLSAGNILGTEEQKCILIWHHLVSLNTFAIVDIPSSGNVEFSRFSVDPRSSGEWYSVSAPRLRSPIMASVLYFLNVRIFA